MPDHPADLSDERLAEIVSTSRFMLPEIPAILGELQRRREEARWRPIETAPETGAPDSEPSRLWLISHDGIQFAGFRQGFPAGQRNRYVEPYSGRIRVCTHWRPLPTQPGGENE